MVRGQFSSGEIVRGGSFPWGQLSSGEIFRGVIFGGQSSKGQLSGGQFSSGAIVLEPLLLYFSDSMTGSRNSIVVLY